MTFQSTTHITDEDVFARDFVINLKTNKHTQHFTCTKLDYESRT